VTSDSLLGTATHETTLMRSALTVALLLLCTACGKPPPPAPAVPSVLVGHALAQRVTDWDDYAGRFEAVESVEVRPRVTGAIESIHFKDGEHVARGQLLVVIDSRPYAAALARAKADLARAEAALANADVELKRAKSLAASQLISSSQLDTKAAAQLQAAADLASAQAAVESQALNLSFTRITAPISGRASWQRLTTGNLVAADSTLLTMIVSEDPIRFVFNAPESALLKYRREGGGAEGSAVEIRLQDELAYRWKGRVDFIDNAIDRSSGTIRARAVVGNPKGFLAPGMFGQLRLFASSPVDVLMLPDQAVVTDQTRQVVYVVDAEGTVAQKVVQPGRLLDGLRVIRAGITAADRVIISGVQRARPGRKVAVTEGEVSAYPSGISRGEDGALTPPAAGLR
jgi:RND family efflux transporter MFP subunit